MGLADGVLWGLALFKSDLPIICGKVRHTIAGCGAVPHGGVKKCWGASVVSQCFGALLAFVGKGKEY